jgi:transposase
VFVILRAFETWWLKIFCHKAYYIAVAKKKIKLHFCKLIYKDKNYSLILKDMNKVKKITAKTLIATVDVSKGKHTGFFRTIDNDTIKPFEFCNTKKGFNEFWSRIMSFKQKHKLDKILFGCESTGSYGFPILQFMKSKGAEVVQVNPKHVKRIKEITDNSPNKTDNKDSRVIADVLLLGRYLQVNFPGGKVADLRCKVQYRENLIEDISRIKNRLEGLLAQFFPEFLDVMQGFRSKTSMYLLEHYPTPSKLAELGAERLSKELKKVSRGRFSYVKATGLIYNANNTIGLKEGIKGYEDQVKCYMGQLSILNHQLKEKEAEIEAILNDIAISRLLLSIKGLGKITVSIILSEIVDFTSFSIIPEVLKYAGLNLYEISSGKHKGQRRISKRGRSLLRKALFYASLNLIRKGGAFHEDYKRHLSNGMKPIKAVVAISGKLLRVIFAMVRDGKEFKVKEQLENIKMAA